MRPNGTSKYGGGLLIWLGVLALFAGLIPESVLPLGAEEPLRIVVDLRPAPEFQPIFDWLAQGKWCWGVEVNAGTEESAIRHLRQQGWEVIVSLNAHEPTRRRDAAYKRRGLLEPNEIIGRHIRAADGQADKVIWLALLENDSAGVAFPQELLGARPRTHEQAYRLTKDNLQQALQTTKTFPGVKIWGVCGYASGAHPFAAGGLDCVLIERANDDVEDLQTGIAFCRGAGNQYGCSWGIDLSLWWGPIYGCVQNMPSSYYKRHLYLSYFSGARAFRLEGMDLLWDQTQKKFSPLTTLLDEFGAFCRQYPAGQVEVPVAVMLPPDHGWITPPYWRTQAQAWNYARMPYRMGQKAIDGFFATAFPGSNFAMEPFPFGSYGKDDPPASPFALSCVTPEFAPRAEDVFFTEVPLPFGRFENRNQARETMLAQTMDPAPYRPMGDSRWGDILDVLTTCTPADILQHYKVLILLDQIKLTPELQEKLLNYVKAGGKLVWSAGVVGPQQAALCGLEMTPEFRVGRAWHWGKEDWISEAYHYVPARGLSEKASLLAQAPNGDPLIIRQSLEKGDIYTCLVPWFEGPVEPLAGVAQKLFDTVMAQVQPVVVEGLPVEWVSTLQDGQHTVVLANHDGQPWRGKVTLKSSTKDKLTCTELFSGKKLSVHRKDTGYQVTLDIPAYEVSVIRWQ